MIVFDGGWRLWLANCVGYFRRSLERGVQTQKHQLAGVDVFIAFRTFFCFKTRRCAGAKLTLLTYFDNSLVLVFWVLFSALSSPFFVASGHSVVGNGKMH